MPANDTLAIDFKLDFHRGAEQRLNRQIIAESRSGDPDRTVDNSGFPLSGQNLMNVLGDAIMHTPPRPRLVLASSSRYRRELLERLGVAFEIDAPAIDETPGDESPLETARRLALEKALGVAPRHPGALVIGSDQVATVDGLSIGKPGTHERALEQLKLLRGRAVLFHTAICLVDTRADAADADAVQTEVASVTVRFRNLSDAELDAYLHIERPYDCAGSAKAEGLGIALLESIESDDPTALIGLPLIRLVTMLGNRGYLPF